ncbi:hypothetical protein Jinkies_53 [Arthrobacter phage Jinkies]|uniref:Uncharacterized protein n=1 Tax=Arthrobacter phage Jinkies TaxID=2743903 RepID=A0A7S6BF85_9CAUD|nr:hypothetical protein Jinkies_53 [Arthrobacter phage Jinkies]
MTATTELPTWDIFKPYGDEDDHASLVRATIDGIEWVSDRYVMVRTDMLDGERSEAIQTFCGDKANEGFAEALPRLFALKPLPETAQPSPLHPIYLAAFEGYDWTPVEKGQWQIRRDGELVAMVCGLTYLDGYTPKPGDGGLPGAITPFMRRAYQIIRAEVWNDRAAWTIAYKIGLEK